MVRTETRASLAQSGVTSSPSSLAEFGQYLNDEFIRWGRIIREKNIKGE